MKKVNLMLEMKNQGIRKITNFAMEINNNSGKQYNSMISTTTSSVVYTMNTKQLTSILFISQIVYLKIFYPFKISTYEGLTFKYHSIIFSLIK